MTNSSFTSKSFALLACLACLTLLFSVLGCNTENVTAPAPAPERIVTNPNFVVILSTPKNAVRPAFSSSVSNVVSAENGGSVANDFVSLSFPPGALNEDTEITIEMPDPGKMIFEFGPHGTQFNKPVVMTVDLENTSAAGMSDNTETLWFNDEMGWWEPIKKIDSSDDDSAKSELEHFSKYAQLNG